MAENIKLEYKLDRIKAKILDLLENYEGGCDDKEILNFEQWISSRNYVKDLEKFKEKGETENKLDSIVNKLRKLMPDNGILKSEKIINPESGPNSDCDENTLHVDEFLYDEKDIEQYYPKADKYCNKCGSNDIQDTQLISHSLSRAKMKYLFNVMLPSEISDMKILDIGSRIGAVLYGAYFYTNSKNIFGIEINEELHNVQKKIITDFHLDDRIRIINDDILNQGDIMDTFDVVILNNVFEFFLSSDQETTIWRFLKNKLKKGCLVATIPSVEETFVRLDVFEEFSTWLKLIPVNQPENGFLLDDEDEADFHEMHLYTVYG